MTDQVIYYVSLSELANNGMPSKPWKKFSLISFHDGRRLELWEDVCYALEEKMGMHSNAASCYLAGMERGVFKAAGNRWCLEQRMRAADAVKPRTAFILMRCPLPHAIPIYVPYRFQSEAQREEQRRKEARQLLDMQIEAAMDEETRMKAVLGQDAKELMPAAVRKRKYKHAAEYEYRGVKPVPPDDYMCKGCGKSEDHFRADCPYDKKENKDGEVAIDRIIIPHGVPKMFLKRNDQRQTMMTRDGVFVNDIRTTQLPSIAILDVVVKKRRTIDPDDEELAFEFEDYLEERDRMEAQQEDEFYATHPESRKKLQSMCTHWLRGLCQKGTLMCEYLHQYSAETMPICKFFLQGKCTNDDCSFKHELPPSTTHVERCVDYATGFCARGPRCPLTHIKRSAPSITDFDGLDKLFKTMVACFDKFMAEQRKEELAAAKKYSHAPSAIQALYAKRRSKSNKMLAEQ
jgi:hypothetical protein